MPAESQSFMHLIQAFVVDVAASVRDQLPADATVTTAGRTIVRFERPAGAYGVRVRVGKHDDDMWPHIEALLETPDGEQLLEMHPDTDVDGHASAILEALGVGS